MPPVEAATGLLSQPAFQAHSHTRRILPLTRLDSPSLARICLALDFLLQPHGLRLLISLVHQQIKSWLLWISLHHPVSLLVLIYSTEFLDRSSLFESEQVHFEKLLQQNGVLEESLHGISSSTRRSA
jgi:hypothetical protein